MSTRTSAFILFTREWRQRIGALLVASIASLLPVACGEEAASPPSGSSSGGGGSGVVGGAAGSRGGGAAAGVGGLSGSGGATTGGSAGLGGTAGNGGSSGGRAGTGGSAGSTGGTAGGSLDGGGAQGSGGSTGGTSGSSGAAGAGNTCTEADKTVCNNEVGRHCGYTYEYWKDQGTGCLVNTSNGFSVNWSNINNLLGRKGLRPGSTNQIVTYQANYLPNGNSYLCVYGWTQNPLVEYYIVDSWGSWRPPGGTAMGSAVASDGGTYDVYRTQRVNQPSIEGTKTFYQYWSVRTEKRASGTITVANHFNAWASRGMNMGSLYEVSMTVEGYQSSGTADLSFSMR